MVQDFRSDGYCKSNKETQSPVTRVFQEMMQREKKCNDPERASLLKENQLENQKRHEHQSKSIVPIERPRPQTSAEMKGQQKTPRDYGYDYQTYMAKDKKKKDKKKRDPTINDCNFDDDESCSRMSCAIKKIVRSEFAGVGCLLIGIIFMAAVLINHCCCTSCVKTATDLMSGRKYEAKPKRMDRMNQDRSDLERLQDVVGLKGDERKYDVDDYKVGAEGRYFRDSGNIAFKDDMISKDLARLQLDRLNRDTEKDYLRDFYKKLVQADVKIKQLKENDNNMPPLSSSYINEIKHFKRSLKSVNITDNSLENINGNKVMELMKNDVNLIDSRKDRDIEQEEIKNIKSFLNQIDSINQERFKRKNNTEEAVVQSRRRRADEDKNDSVNLDDNEVGMNLNVDANKVKGSDQIVDPVPSWKKFNIFIPEMYANNLDDQTVTDMPDITDKLQVTDTPDIADKPQELLIKIDKVLIGYAKPYERKSKCSHTPKNEAHEKHLKHPFYKNTERFDEMLDKYVNDVRTVMMPIQNRHKYRKTQRIKIIDLDDRYAISSRPFPNREREKLEASEYKFKVSTDSYSSQQTEKATEDSYSGQQNEKMTESTYSGLQKEKVSEKSYSDQQKVLLAEGISSGQQKENVSEDTYSGQQIEKQIEDSYFGQQKDKVTDKDFLQLYDLLNINENKEAATLKTESEYQTKENVVKNEAGSEKQLVQETETVEKDDKTEATPAKIKEKGIESIKSEIENFRKIVAAPDKIKEGLESMKSEIEAIEKENNNVAAPDQIKEKGTESMKSEIETDNKIVAIPAKKKEQGLESMKSEIEAIEKENNYAAAQAQIKEQGMESMKSEMENDNKIAATPTKMKEQGIESMQSQIEAIENEIRSPDTVLNNENEISSGFDIERAANKQIKTKKYALVLGITTIFGSDKTKRKATTPNPIAEKPSAFTMICTQSDNKEMDLAPMLMEIRQTLESKMQDNIQATPKTTLYLDSFFGTATVANINGLDSDADEQRTQTPGKFQYANFSETVPKRHILEAEDEDDEALGYEDVKEVLSDDSDSHDESERQIDKRESNPEFDEEEEDTDYEKDSEASEVDEGSEGQIDPEFDDNSEFREAADDVSAVDENRVSNDKVEAVGEDQKVPENLLKERKETKDAELNVVNEIGKNQDSKVKASPLYDETKMGITPMGSMKMYNPNWKGPMPLYPGEMGTVLKSVKDKSHKMVRQEAKYYDFPIVDDMEEFLNNKYDKAAKTSVTAQAYSDYGVFDGKKDTIKNEKNVINNNLDKAQDFSRFNFKANLDSGSATEDAAYDDSEGVDITNDSKKLLSKHVQITSESDYRQDQTPQPIESEVKKIHTERKGKRKCKSKAGSYEPISEWEFDNEGVKFEISPNCKSQEKGAEKFFGSIRDHVKFIPITTTVHAQQITQKEAPAKSDTVYTDSADSVSEGHLKVRRRNTHRKQRSLLWLDRNKEVDADGPKPSNLSVLDRTTSLIAMSPTKVTTLNAKSTKNVTNLNPVSTKNVTKLNATSTEQATNLIALSITTFKAKVENVTNDGNITDSANHTCTVITSTNNHTVSKNIIGYPKSNSTLREPTLNSTEVNLFHASSNVLVNKTANVSKALEDDHIKKMFNAFQYLSSLAEWFNTLARLSDEAKISNEKSNITPYSTPPKENISDIVYQMYDSEAMVENIGHRSRVLLAIDDNSTASSSMVDGYSSEAAMSSVSSTNNTSVMLTTTTQSTTANSNPGTVNDTADLVANRTVVKRSVEQGISWSDVYDDEYGIKSETDLERIKHSEESRVLDGWKDKMVGLVSNVVKKMESHGHKAKRTPRDSEEKEPLQATSPLTISAKNEKIVTVQAQDPKAMFAALTAEMKEICKQAADAIAQKNIDIRENRQTDEATSLMQQLVKMMNEVVTYQVKRQTCLKLPPDLESYLKWLTSSQDSENRGTYEVKMEPHENSMFDSQGLHSNSGSKVSSPDEEIVGREKEDQPESRSDCLGTLRAVEELIARYDSMSIEDKNKMTGVREYLENQLNYLRQLDSNEFSKSPLLNTNFDLKRRRRSKRYLVTRSKKDKKNRIPKRRLERKLSKSKFNKKHTKAPISKSNAHNQAKLTTTLMKGEKKTAHRKNAKLATTTAKNQIINKSDVKETIYDKRNLKDVYYKALADAKKYTTKNRSIKDYGLDDKINILSGTG